MHIKIQNILVTIKMYYSIKIHIDSVYFMKGTNLSNVFNRNISVQIFLSNRYISYGLQEIFTHISSF